MSTSRTCYFVAGGRTVAAIEDYFARRGAHRTAMEGLANDLGCSGLYQCRGLVSGFQAPKDDSIPTGLRRSSRASGMLVPHKGTAEGKAIVKRMKALPAGMSIDALMVAMGMKDELFFVDGGCCTASVGVECIDDVYVVKLHADDEGNPRGGAPYDSERIADSTYWLMVEQSKAAKKARAAAASAGVEASP